MHRWLLLALPATLAILLISGSAFAGNWGKVSAEEWQLGAPIDYPEANALVVFDRCSLMVDINQIEIERHVRMKLLRKAGAEEIGDIEIWYRDDDKLRDVEAQVIYPDGRKVKVDSKNMFDKTVKSHLFRTFAFPSADSGCVLEYRYRNVNDNFFNLLPWYFQSDVYTLDSRVALTLAPGYQYSASYANVPAPNREPAVEVGHEIGNMDIKLKTYVWERKNVPPITDEPYMGSQEDYYSALYFQLVSYESPSQFIPLTRTWSEMGVTYQKWFDNYVRSGGLKGIVAEAIVGAQSHLDSAAMLYNWVAANIAVSDALSRRSYESIDEVVKSRTGTAEDKNELLVALFRQAGMKAYPVLVSTRDQRRFNPEIQQLSQFNHTLCFVQFADSSYVFLDASTRHCPFGMLPPSSLVDGGFLIDGKESQIVNVVRKEPTTTRIDETHIFVDTEGAARCSSLCTFSGYFAPRYGRLSESQAAEEFCKDYFTSKTSGQAELVSHTLGTDSTGRFVVTLVYTVKEFARELDNNLMVKPVTYRFAENPFTRARRSYPIDFEFAHTYRNAVYIHSDRPVVSATLPQPVNVTQAGLSYRRTAAWRDGVAKVEATMTISEPMFAPGQYTQVKQFFESVASAAQDEVALQLGAQ